MLRNIPFRSMGHALILSILLIAVVPALAFAGGGQENHTDDDHIEELDTELPQLAAITHDGQLKIVATTSIIADVAAIIGGDYIEIRTIIPRGSSPHGYEPVPADLRAMDEADLVLINGAALEESLLPSLEAMKGVAIAAVSPGFAIDHEDEDHDEDGDHHEGDDDHDEDGDHHEDEDHDEDGEHHHAQGNPHYWFDPMAVAIWADNIAQLFSQLDPDHADYFAANAAQYRAQLAQIDAEIGALFAAIPAEKRVVISDHDSLSYFAERYSIRIVGTVLPGFSDTGEPSARDIAMLLDLAEDEDVSVLAVGNTSAAALAEVLEAIRAESDNELSIVEFLAGGLAPAGQAGDSYITYMRENARRLAAAMSK